MLSVNLIFVAAISSCIVEDVILTTDPKTSNNLLLISLDGFKWDYLNRGYYTPNLNLLIDKGVKAKSMKPVLPSSTFPNHFSIVTGLYPESHGVVDNYFYDPLFNETFNCLLDSSTAQPDKEKKWLNYNGKVEPIWVTNQKIKGHRAGAIFWPGIEVWPEIFDERIMVSNVSNWNNIHFNARVQMMMEWFQSRNPINLGILYFEEPDLEGHLHGPGKEIRQMIENLDRTIGYLIAELKNAKLFDKMNIIIVSDHGMTTFYNLPNTTFAIENYVNQEHYNHISINHRYVLMSLTASSPAIVHELIRNISQISPHVHARRKKDFPKGYQHNRRIGDVLVTVDEGFLLATNFTWDPDHKKGPVGVHGYDNNLQSMQGIFIGYGPAFKSKYTSPPIDNIELYNLMCHILGVSPAPNNGSFENVKQYLKATEETGMYTITFFVLVITAACITGLCTIGAVRQYRVHTKKSSTYLRRTIGLDGLNMESKTTLLGTDTEDEF